jgi:diguanylate cyclase (GGDEF)-like protein
MTAWTRPSGPHDPRRRIRPSAWIACVVGLGLTLGAFGYVRAAIVADDEDRLQEVEDLAAERIREQLVLGDALLASGQGLFSGSEVVSASEFARLVGALRLAERAPATRVVGFITRVDGRDASVPVPDDLTPSDGQVPSDLPTGEGPRAIVTYAVPGDETWVAGADVGDAALLDALEAAREFSTTIATGPIVGADGRAGFALVAPAVLPVPPSSSGAMDGWVFIWIDADEFLAQVVAPLDLPIAAELTTSAVGGSTTETLGTWPEGLTSLGDAGTMRRITDHGHTWTLRIAATGYLAGHSRGLPMLVLVAGVALSALATALVQLVGSSLERRRAEAHLSHQATHDPLTELPNRTLFVDRVEQAVARAERSERPVAVLFLDLDRFKVVNDSLGHRAGDELLVAAAQRLRAVVRPADTVARFGGDEFVVLCEDVDEARVAVDVARRVVAALEEPFVLGGREVFVSASVGICMATDSRSTPDDLLRNADTAMFRAKGRGGARVAMFDDAMQAWAEGRFETEVALRRAVERGELRVHYQPVVHLDSADIVALEALVRWDRPGVGLVTPSEFIPIAEETGLIVPLGTWVLEEACRQVAAWQDLGPRGTLGVTVNMSGRQLVQPDVVEVVRTALARAQLDPGLLTLEITESVLLDDDAHAIDVLGALKDLGVRLAIDDFGTGYSSLTYLRHFPFDVVKVDQSFVHNLGTNVEDSTIVAAVIALSKALGLRVVAEGIETAEHLAALLNLDCDYAQGYFFSRPMPADVTEALLTAGLPSPLPARAM